MLQCIAGCGTPLVSCAGILGHRQPLVLQYVLQGFAACCRVLQCVAPLTAARAEIFGWASTGVAVCMELCCRVLQGGATPCNMGWHGVAGCCRMLSDVMVCCRLLQFVAGCGMVLQSVVV